MRKPQPYGDEALERWREGLRAFERGDYAEARRLAEGMLASDRNAMLKRLEQAETKK